MLLGPFTGEIEYELLYWIPYLRSRLGDKFKDCVAISRGKTDLWYPCEVINAYDLVPPDRHFKLMADRRGRTGSFKSHSREEPLDRLIIQMAGLGEPDIHPEEMYAGLKNMQCRDYLAWPRPRYSKPARYPGLPEQYTAARFYNNDWFAGVAKVGDLVDLPVVVLKLRGICDNHEEVQVEFGEGMVLEYSPWDSLDVITRVVANADGFYCSYGSMWGVGVMFGTPTVGYSTIEHKGCHHDELEEQIRGSLDAEKYCLTAPNKYWKGWGNVAGRQIY